MLLPSLTVLIQRDAKIPDQTRIYGRLRRETESALFGCPNARLSPLSKGSGPKCGKAVHITDFEMESVLKVIRS
jgi:hypothetical protein